MRLWLLPSRLGQKKGGSYEFADIVETEKTKALGQLGQKLRGLWIEGVNWSNFKQQYNLYEKDLDEVSGRLRKEEMRRLATRVERWVRSRLGESVGLEFNELGSGRAVKYLEMVTNATEKDLWDRIWDLFTKTVKEAEIRFT